MLQQMRFLFLMVQKVIPVIFRRFSEQIIRLLCVTRFIRFMWIPMLWRGGPGAARWRGVQNIPRLWQALADRGYPRQLLADLFWNNLRRLI